MYGSSIIICIIFDYAIILIIIQMFITSFCLNMHKWQYAMIVMQLL